MNKLLLSCISLLLTYSIFAQDIRIIESTVEHNDKNRPSLSVTINPDTKAVKKKWKDFMDDKYDVDVKGIGFLTNKDVLTSEQVTLKKISEKQLDLFAKVVEVNDKTRIDIFAAPGYDIYIDPQSSPRAFGGMRSILVEFLNYYLPEFYQEKVEDAQDDYEDLVDSRDELKDNIEDNINEIDELREEIKNLRKENQNLGNDLVETRNKLGDAEQKLMEKKDKKKQVNKRINTLKENQK